MIVLLLATLGLAFGSFVNALVWRLHEGRDWIRERSECTHCHHVLAPKDLIPVVSWLLLRGRCRYCRRPIQDGPIIELAVPAVWIISYIYWPAPLSGQGLFDFIVWLIFLVGFAALALYDGKWYLLPDVIVFPLIALAFLQVGADWLLFDHRSVTLTGPLTGAAVISGLFFLLFHVSNGKWIGFGDVKLGIILGLLAGDALPALLVLLTASLIGTAIALPLVVQGRASRKSHLPFGPLLIAGVIATQLFGMDLIGWYLNLLAV